MNIYTTNRFRGWKPFLGTMLTVALMLPSLTFSQYSNPAPVPLLTAGTYGALAYSGITGSANVNGDVGTLISSVGAGITATGGGTNYGGGGAHNGDAQTDLTAALSNALGRINDETVAANALGGLNLGRGVYTGGGLDLASNTTLTLTGSATDVFIIKAASTLTINTNSTIVLAGGVVWSNVFWYVGSSATIFSGTTFNGIILSDESITLNSSATLVTARLLASTGTVTINSTVLPVELVSFTASANNMNADLRWSTATEVNNFGFEIQRSVVSDLSSENNWTKTGFVDGAGTSNTPKNYSFIDNNLSSGNYSYRLKQIDRDGKFTYSQSVEVMIGQIPKEFALLQNYPNPFNPSTMISYQLPANDHVSLIVYNAIGSEVAALVNGQQEAGSYAVPFNTNNGIHNLSSGVYFYRLQTGSFVSTKKLILVK